MADENENEEESEFIQVEGDNIDKLNDADNNVSKSVQIETPN